MTIFQGDPGPDKVPNVPGGDNSIVKQMAVAGGALPRLDDSKPVYVAVGSDFQGITARTLGNAITGSDGYDSIVAAPLGAFDGDVAALPQLDQHIADADYGDGQFRAGNIDPIVADAGPFITTGDSIIGVTPDPPPANDPGSPPSGSGGSGGPADDPPEEGSYCALSGGRDGAWHWTGTAWVCQPSQLK
jgi:hypothetical protein